jgi:formiminoglutamase
MNRYRLLEPVNNKIWQGRIDDMEDYDAFRWHQWVQPIDLEDMNQGIRGSINICFVGFCCDQGVDRNKGRVGASKGPDSIRREMANLPCHFLKDVKLFDAGNIIAKYVTLEEAQSALSGIVNDILALNMFPIVLGGGHEIAFGHYNGIRSYLKKSKSIGIINFDAHLDIRPYPNGGSSGTMFRQIYDECQKEKLDYGYMCIGAQRRGNTVKLFKDANNMGVDYIFTKDMFESLPHDKLQGFINKYDQLYMTICADVFASAFAPGVSAAQAIGLEPEQVISLMKQVIESGKLVSFDIAEVSPRFDHDKVTSNLAAVLIFAVVTTIAKLNNLDIDIF